MSPPISRTQNGPQTGSSDRTSCRVSFEGTHLLRRAQSTPNRWARVLLVQDDTDRPRSATPHQIQANPCLESTIASTASFDFASNGIRPYVWPRKPIFEGENNHWQPGKRHGESSRYLGGTRWQRTWEGLVKCTPGILQI